MRVRFVSLVVMLLAVSCTGGRAGPAAPGTPQGSGAQFPTVVPSSPGPRPIVLEVVADTTHGTTGAADDSTYLDGMQAAATYVNDAGGVGGRPIQLHVVDDGGDQGRATAVVGSLLDGKPAAILYVGPGRALPPLRERFAQTQIPVVLLQGDLYTSRQLFPQAFQVGAPWEWQIKVIAKYLVTDRKASKIGFYGSGPDASTASDSARAAVSYWGGRLVHRTTYDEGALLHLSYNMVSAKPDAVAVFGDSADVRRIAMTAGAGLVGARAAGSASLLFRPAGTASLAPGTTACYTYTWAGWAEPIPRVGRFIRSFQAQFGHPPVGFEQEGYDAVRAISLALERDGARGGSSLIHALEGIKETSFSSFPIDLGPDDHVFLPRDELGLFAVPGPHERLDPWQSRALAGELWRPVMRTFTYDGQRDNILDQDRPVFFPGWKEKQPGPYYWESRYGIVSRPGDTLH